MSKPQLLLIGGATQRMLDAVGAVFEIHATAPDNRADVIAAQGAEIEAVLHVGHDGVTAEQIAKMPKLRIISNYGVGYDAIDTQEAVARGIVVTHTPDVLNDDVANTAILLLLAVTRNFVADHAHLMAGKWETEGSAPLTRSIHGLTAGILGLGRIGKMVAEKLAPFGVSVAYNGRSKQDVPYRYYADLTEMAKDIDILICVAPGGAATHHLINADVMNALGPRGILINIGRGSVVDETALITALSEGRLGAAGLDVFESEPHVPAELMALPNATLLPHVASATVETRQAMGDLAVENLLSFQSTGKTKTPVPECKDM